MDSPAVFRDLMQAVSRSDRRPLYRVTVRTAPEAAEQTWWVRTTTEHSAKQAALAVIAEVKRISQGDLVVALAEELKRARDGKSSELKDLGDDGSWIAG
jgi:hypothetical protein